LTDTPNGDVGDPNAPITPPPPPSTPPTAPGSVPPPPMQPAAESTKWFEAIGIVILSLVCCWPLGLVLLWTNKKFTQKTKLIVTGVIVGVLLIGGIAGVASGGSSSSSDSSSTPKVTTATIAKANTTTTEGAAKTTTTKAPTTTAAPKNSAKITKAEFDQIQDGMTRAQVAEIVGSPGEVLSESTIAGYKTVMVSWEGSSFASNANAMF
jgi:hypothetical protein